MKAADERRDGRSVREGMIVGIEERERKRKTGRERERESQKIIRSSFFTQPVQIAISDAIVPQRKTLQQIIPSRLCSQLTCSPFPGRSAAAQPNGTTQYP